MGAVKIRAQYTKDNRIFNGLESIAGKMLADPAARVIAVVVFEVAKKNVDYLNGGQESVTVNAAEIEPVFDGDAREARQLLERAYKTRTGHPQAPVLFGDEAMADEDEDLEEDADDEGEAPPPLGPEDVGDILAATNEEARK